MNERSFKRSKLVALGIEAVLAGARIAEKTNLKDVVFQKQSLRDIVTHADLEISRLLEEKLSGQGFSVLSEESLTGKSDLLDFWVLDPIDGTANFANGLPLYAVSIGWVENFSATLGFVCAPSLDELYVTLNEDTASLNGRQILHDHTNIETSLVAASFSTNSSKAHHVLFQRVNEITRGCLRTGSAALNLCWTSSNRFQAAYGFGAKIWDVAGGLAIAKNSGCDVRLRMYPDNLTFDYCVGSRDVVDSIIAEARVLNLWGDIIV